MRVVCQPEATCQMMAVLSTEAVRIIFESGDQTRS